jgi:glycosyltransferase involved in cell wall biosynthesis
VKILQIISSIGPTYGGPSRSVSEISRGLALAGHEVTIAVTNADNKTNCNFPLDSDFSVPNLKLIIFPRWGTNRWQFSSKLCFWLLENLQKFDLVHSHGLFSYVPLMGHLLAKFHKVASVMTPLGMLNNVALQPGGVIKKTWLSLIDLPCLKTADAIVVKNRLEYQQLERFGLKKLGTIIPNGLRAHIDKSDDYQVWYQKFPQTKSCEFIIVLGRLDPIKGLTELLNAFQLVRKKHPNILLVLAGADNIGYQRILEIHAESLGVKSAVVFTGHLTGVLKDNALNLAKVFVQCSYSEGFSSSILEAMYAAKPCLITEGCNFPEASEAAVVRVVPNNIEHIADGLCNILRNYEAAQCMGQAAKLWVIENYQWNKIAHQFTSLYESVTKLRVNSP